MFSLSPLFIACAVALSPVAIANHSPLGAPIALVQLMQQAQLASVYEARNVSDIRHYLVSEKYDGIRAIWTGSQLITRNGHPIFAPKWFTAPLPNVWLDGELWIQRGDFERVSSIVRKHSPVTEEWQQVKFMVFDMPALELPFKQRYHQYQLVVSAIKAPHIHAVTQHQFTSQQALQQHFTELVSHGAEGVMLHLANAYHQPGRSSALLKLKPHYDAEAKVIAHLPGRGKYTGMLGALRVRNESGVEFSIGTGFTDSQRAHPPAIGSVVTYKYQGYTKNGIPRFASFLRVRNQPHETTQ